MKTASSINNSGKRQLIKCCFTLASKCLLPLLLSCIGLMVQAQEKTHSEEAFEPHHGIALLLSHTHTAQGSEDGKKKWLALPSWAMDYNYFFSKKWGLGLHNDMILETFKVEDHNTNQEVIERTRPVACVAVVSFKPGKHFSFEFGAGGEFAKEGNYYLNRLGVEYALELPNRWEMISNLLWDLKWQAYNSFSIGVGVSKAFGFRKIK
jgi:hypothetical protein